MKIELNLRGINELMQSGPIQEALQNAGEAVAQAASGMAAGEPFGVRTHLADFVAIANVYPDSKAAQRANLSDNVLLKGVGSAGLPTRKPKL